MENLITWIHNRWRHIVNDYVDVRKLVLSRTNQISG